MIFALIIDDDWFWLDFLFYLNNYFLYHKNL